MLFELTHGPTYLVFKHQLYACKYPQAKFLIIQNQKLVSSAASDFPHLDLHFGIFQFGEPQGQICILYKRLSLVKPDCTFS